MTGLSLKRDPVDRDRAKDRAKRHGAILQWNREKDKLNYFPYRVNYHANRSCLVSLIQPTSLQKLNEH